MSAAGVTLTTSADTFIDGLGPGDVLLFDSLRPVSHIIKLAENRPVNHAALYAGAGQFLHATTHEPGQPVVQRASLRARLRNGHDRTVTSLRHRQAGAGTSGRSVVFAGERMADESRTYAFVDLLTLVVPTFFRSYRRYLDSGGKLQAGSSVLLARLSRGLLADVAVFADGSGDHGGDAWSLTCSEFVFRCYDDAASGSLVVTEPLSRWGPVLATRGSVTFPGGLDFHPSLSPIASTDTEAGEAPAVGSVERGLGSGREVAELLARSLRAISGQASRNYARSKYGTRPPAQGVPLPDTVTPRDLWSSPSLTVTGVYHRPPSGDDDQLDDLRH